MNIFKRLLCTTILLSVLTPFVNAQSGELIDYTFNHDELSREYSIYVPEDYTSEEEWPLILNFHGYSGDVPDHIDRTQMHGLADEFGFLIAYPVGLSITRDPEILPAFVPSSGAGWSVPGFSNERNELVFVDSLLNNIQSGYSVNLKRVHATGLSLGGYMAAYIGTQMPDKIASFASVAGHFTNETTDLIDDSTKISGIMIHGTSDAITNYNGLDNQYESVPESAGLLSNLNQCSSESEETNLPDLDSSDNTTVTLIEYLGCKNERQVKVYRVNNGGHRWPGSGRLESAQVLGNNSLDINSSKLIMEFFEANQQVIVSSESEDYSAIRTFKLSQNYPNPFNPSTNISFQLPEAGLVQLKVYNLLGQEIDYLVNGRMNAGKHNLTFDASQLSSGVYIYRLITGNQSITKKMMLIK